MTERATIFGQDAANYDAARPGYPTEAIGHIKGLVTISRALEIGAGTGKATEAMAGSGFEILVVEPSQEMAAILADRNLAGVSVEVAKFEEWQGTMESFDLIFAAQAWHWVDHSFAYGRVLDLLRPGGALALMWNIPLDRYLKFTEVYEEHAPELLEERDRRIQDRDSDKWGNDMSTAGFVDVGQSTFLWADTLGPQQVRALYASYSDHMMLPERQRRALLDGLADAVLDMGGTIDLDYRTEVFTGRRPDEPDR